MSCKFVGDTFGFYDYLLWNRPGGARIGAKIPDSLSTSAHREIVSYETRVWNIEK